MREKLDSKAVAALALGEFYCRDCSARPGEPCKGYVADRVHLIRWQAAAIQETRKARAARLTDEQRAVLAELPHVSAVEIEKQRTERGGYVFSREWAESVGLPWPLPSGWRKAVTRNG